MASLIKKISKKGLIRPPDYVVDQTQYEVIMGSVAYGVSNDDSDIDVYGFCIPDKHIVFPHTSGEIQGFGKQIQRFEQYQQHHVIDKDDDKEYDFSIYNIVKYFQLCMENNPNMIDSLFVPQRCVIHCSMIGGIVRENRKTFLHKGAWYKYKGYAFSQMGKMKNKNPEGKRKDLVEKFGYDTKFATHVVRLLNQIEQIMIEGDLDLERNREQLKSIRRGEWSMEMIEDYFTRKERELEGLYTTSKLQHSPDENKIKELLFNCLEQHFGSLEKTINKDVSVEMMVNDLKEIVRKYGGK